MISGASATSGHRTVKMGTFQPGKLLYHTVTGDSVNLDDHRVTPILKMLFDYLQQDTPAPGALFPLTGKTPSESITILLSQVNGGDRDAFDQLVPLVYHELHRIADGYLRRESQSHTLQPTALVHEVSLRLADYGGNDYESRRHFYAI